MTLTAERLRQVLTYDPATGIFRWAEKLSIRIQKGAVAGYTDPRPGKWHGRVYLRIDTKLYLAHRLAWLYAHGEWPAAQIDHINGNPNDNRLENLRGATHAENARNSRKPRNATTSRLKGVSFDKSRGKWMAQIGHDGQHIHLGRHNTEEAAHAAYCAAAEHLHGNFARLA